MGLRNFFLRPEMPPNLSPTACAPTTLLSVAVLLGAMEAEAGPIRLALRSSCRRSNQSVSRAHMEK